MILLYEYFHYQENVSSELTIVAEMIGFNTAAAIVVGDGQTAVNTLQALRADDRILAGRLYTKEGKTVATFFREDTGTPDVPIVLREPGDYLEGEHLLLFRRVVMDGETVGSIYLQASLEGARERLWQDAGFIGFGMLLSLTVTLLVSTRLQKLIADPLLRLARVAKGVSEEKDYSARVTRGGNDELGVLIDAFNQMLEKVEDRGAHLEAEVTKRTRALAESEERSRRLVETTNVIPWEADADTLQFTYVGPRIAKLLGHEAQDWGMENFWTDHLHKPDLIFVGPREQLDGGPHDLPGDDKFLTKPVTAGALSEMILHPAAENSDLPIDSPDRSPGAESAEGSPGLRILVVEDLPENQILMTHLLEHQGHSVIIASNGKEAVRLFEVETYDLVLMDLQMPEMGGFEATVQIRTMERSKGGHTPVIGVTAYAMKGDRERCLSVGMDEYIAKPIHREQLFEAIERCLRSRTAA